MRVCTFVVVVKFHMNDFKMWQYYSSTSSSFNSFFILVVYSVGFGLKFQWFLGSKVSHRSSIGCYFENMTQEKSQHSSLLEQVHLLTKCRAKVKIRRWKMTNLSSLWRQTHCRISIMPFLVSNWTSNLVVVKTYDITFKVSKRWLQLEIN